MPSTYQRIFEYYKVAESELMLTEIIPYKIPVLYKGSTINTYKWMNFNSWHEIYSHLDEIVHDYSEKSISRNMQYVKGISTVIGYQFQSVDPHYQMLHKKFFFSNEKEQIIEFKICSLKLVASIYPLQLNWPEIELPYYFVRNYDILKGLLKKDVKKRISLSKLNQERGKRLTMSKEIQTSPQSKSGKFDGRNDVREYRINKSNIFDFSSESTFSSKKNSSSSSSVSRDFDGKVKEKISFSSTSEDDYNNVELKNPDSLKRKNDDSEENDFKNDRGKKKKKRCNSKEKKEIATSRSSKPVNKRESKKKNISEEIKKCTKNESERKQTKITKFLRSSCFRRTDAENTPDNDHFCSFSSVTQKAENGIISNPLKEVRNKFNPKCLANKVVKKNSNDEKKLKNVKESINFCDTLPDLLSEYGEQSQGSDIKNSCNINEVIPEVSKDGKSGNANSFNIDVDSCDILPDLNVYSENSKENEINDINLHVNKSQLSTSKSKFLTKFSLNETTSSLLDLLEPESETTDGSQSSFNDSKLFEVSGNILNSSYNNFTNDTWTDSLPDLTQSTTTKNLNGSLLTLNSPEITNCFIKTRSKITKSSNAYVKRSKGQCSKQNNNVTSKSKYKNNTKGKKISKKSTYKERRQKLPIDSLSTSSSSRSSSVMAKIYKKNKCTAKNSTLRSNRNEESIVLSHVTNSGKNKVEDNLKDHSSADNCEGNFVKTVYDDLRNLTIDDFEYHLKKHSSYFENIILGKIPNDRDKKLFRGCHLPIDMSSELFLHILEENIVDELMDMCGVNFSSIMNASGRNIQVVLYNMLVIIPELLKKVLLSLPCAKENNFSETDCEQIFLQLSTYIDENEQN